MITDRVGLHSVLLPLHIMGIMKTADCTYMFDCHARNCFGMPDPNDSAVVMKFADIFKLEEYFKKSSFT